MPWWRVSLSIVLFRVLAVCASGVDPSVIRFEFAEFTVLENGTNATIDIIRTGDTDAIVSANFGTAGGTAVPGQDYIPAGGNVTFTHGEVRKSFNVGLIDDFDPSTNRTVLLVISNVIGGATLGVPSTATLVIEENDAAIEFAADHYSVAENGGTAIVSAIRRFGTNEDMTVGYFTTAGNATAGGDYLSASGSLTFDAGETNKAFMLSVIDDALVELAETFHVHLTNPAPLGSAFLGSFSNTTIRIVDNEFAPGVVEFARTNFNVFENSGFAAVTLIRTNGYSGTVSVDFQTIATTVPNPPPFPAAPNVDFVFTNGTVVFADGEASKTISLEIIDDELLEPGNELFSVYLAASSGGAVIGLSNATVSIIEDDAPGVLQFATNNIMVQENVGSVAIEIQRLGGSSGPASVDFFTTTNVGASIPAAGTIDYLQQVQTVFFIHGQTTASVSLTVIDDLELEPNEAIGLRLANPIFAALGFVTSATVIIQDNDSEFSFASTNYTVHEGSANVFVTVRRTGATSLPVSVDLVATNGVPGIQVVTNGFTATLITNANNVVIGTNLVPNLSLHTNSIAATNGVHFNGITTTLSFPPGVLFTNVPIAILNDRRVEFDRSFAMRLTNPSAGASLGERSSATATIIENDNAFAFRIGPSNSANGLIFEGDPLINVPMSIEVLRYGSSTGAVSVSLGGFDLSATGGPDYVPPPSTVVFTNGQQNATVLFTIRGDALPEGDEEFAIQLFEPRPTDVTSVGSANVFIPMPVTNTNGNITIIDNDVVFQFATNTVVADEASGTVNLELNRLGAVSVQGTVRIDPTPPGSATPQDYALPSQFITFPPGITSLTIPIQIENDELVELSEFFQLSLNTPATATVGYNALLGSNSPVVVTIRDSAGRIEFAQSGFTVQEHARDALIVLRRVGGAGGPVSVRLNSIGGTASALTDHAGFTNFVINWADGQHGDMTVPMPVYDDGDLEIHETVNLLLSNPTGGVELPNPASHVAIMDNDGLDPPRVFGNTIGFTVRGEPNRLFRVQSSMDLRQWISVETNSTGIGAVDWFHPVPGDGNRFFRFQPIVP